MNPPTVMETSYDRLAQEDRRSDVVSLSPHPDTLLRHATDSPSQVFGSAPLLPATETRRASDGSDDSGSERGGAGRSSRSALLNLCSAAYWYLALYVLLATANAVSSKMMYNRYGQKRAFFVNQFTTVLYDAFAIVMALWQYHRGAITPAMMRFPKKVFLYMGVLDGASTFLGAIGNVHTPGQLQTLLNQLVIPTTLVCSYIWLHRRYVKLQYAGAVVIFAGAALAVVPSIISPPHSDDDDDSTQIRWYSVVVFTLSVIPQSANSVYKEHVLGLDEDAHEDEPLPLTDTVEPRAAPKGMDMDVYYLTAWVSVFQLFLGFLYTPLLALPGFGGTPFHKIPTEFADGWTCFAYGTNSYPDDDCHGAWIITLTYSGVNFLYNIVGLIVFAKASAVLAAIGGAIRLPLTNAVFTMVFIVGRSNVESFTIWNGLGLVVVLGGFLMYAIPTSMMEDAENAKQDAAGKHGAAKNTKLDPADDIEQVASSNSFDKSHSLNQSHAAYQSLAE